MENQKIDQRIAIIGAGAAGLTAAETLKSKGYEHVTIFERSDHVGGKCSTIEIDGFLYELGAGIVEENNRSVLQLADKFGVRTEQIKFKASAFVDLDNGMPLPKKTAVQKVVLYKQLLFTYRKLLRQYNRVAKPGLSKVDPDLYLPFSEWAKKNKVESLIDFFGMYFTGYGYGYVNEVPAVYVLKHYSWGAIRAYLKHNIYKFPDGIQHLWTAVAKDHDVRFNSTIERITRDDDVNITVNGKDLVFDKLIISSPLDETINFMDVSKQESELFSKIQYVDYRTLVLTIRGMKKISGYVPGNYSSSRSGQPVFWYHRHRETDIYTFYVLGDWKMSDDEVIKNTTSLIEKMSGTVGTVHTVSHWKYFPHVTSIVMKAGYFDTLEEMQGEQDTYYVGELLNFSTVGLTSEYADKLIEQFF